MKMLRIVFIFSIISSPIFLKAQDFNLENKLQGDDVETAKGPNAPKFGHFYTGFGLVADQPEGDRDIKYLQSNNIDIGYRYKYKLGDIFSAGWELSYARLKFSYSLADGGGTNVDPQPEKEFLRLHQLKPGIYVRINFDPLRGNKMGKFIDLGGYGSYNFGRNLYQEFDGDNDVARKQKTVYSGLQKIEQFSYGILARIGINRIVFFGQYRLSDINNNDGLVMNEPSRMVAGIQFGIHK
jgi:hypothetical protein